MKLMRLPIIFIFFIYASSLWGQKGYDLTIEIKHVQGQELYLGYHFGNQKYLKDTAFVEGDRARFTGKEPLKPGIYFVYNPKTYFEFVVSEQEFKLVTDTVDFLGNLEIEGSRENKVFKEFHTSMRKSQEDLAELNEQFKSAGSSEDSLKIKKQIQGVGENLEELKQRIIQRNPDLYFTKVLLAMEKPAIPDEIGLGLEEQEMKKAQFEYYRDHYFDLIDFSSEDLLRTPVVHPKIMEYLDRLVNPHPDSIIAAVDDLLDRTVGNEPFFRYLLVTLTSKYERSNVMGHDAIFVHLAEKYYLKGQASWIDNETKQKFNERVQELKPTLIGEHAPFLNLMDTSLNSVTFDDLRSDYTVLYFYDPDCGHCKTKTPALHREYEELKSLGAEVWAVNIQTDVEKWKNFIKTNNLKWINLSDPFVRINFRKEYNINSTPKIFILDRDKKIIARKIGVKQVKEVITLDYLF
jgi:peroxiredoxin